MQDQFSAADIVQFVRAFVVPLIDPELIVGEGFYLGAAEALQTDTTKLYVDVVRVLDDIEFRLKAGLIGSIGNVRIDRLGIQTLTSRDRRDPVAAEVGPGHRRLLDLRPDRPDAGEGGGAPSPGEATVLTDTRLSRTVEVLLAVTYAGSVHTLDIQLALKA